MKINTKEFNLKVADLEISYYHIRYFLVLGVASNILAGYVLCKPNMKNSFNLCLVALAWIDTIFLVGSILESFRKR